MKILLDTLGADKGYEVVVEGGLKALENHPKLEITFIGVEEDINKVKTEFKDSKRISIIDTAEFISNDEEPALAIRRRKNSSMHLGFKKLNEEEYDGFMSCGSTGALLAGATLITKRLDKISRGALTVVMPSKTGYVLLVDAGANMDCSKELLCQFAIMGNVYSKEVLGNKNPRIGLLSVGAEDNKGDSLRKETFGLLKEMDLNFIGNIEGRDALTGDVDVIVSDGFSGNVLLKSIEGTAILLTDILKDSINSSFRNKLGALLMKPALYSLKNSLDYNEVGAAPLLGVKKAVFKAHGSSNARAIEKGIDKLIQFVEKDVIKKIEKNL
ncbi:phosphate acyltransferase PlsX [Lagierella sp.]|uniref:phosphate acyltransferase PlsX n=1 Tax=Lagierella sp. TaxID=2849657 RepID=UPI002624A7E9|nr:phosphate acyltransferase PlsX [Lagierella sp.]